MGTDSGKLAQYHLNMNTVAQLVGAADFTIPAGDVRVGKQDLDVSVGNEFKSTESLKNVVLPLANGEMIHLSDIANVYEALEDASSIGRCNGEDVISWESKTAEFHRDRGFQPGNQEGAGN